MELRYGHNFSKIVDDFSSADFQIAKGRADPLFECRETNTMFILTAHLQGYKRENMKVEIYKDGARIAVSGERPVQETVMVARVVLKREITTRGFRKAFKIPDGVILDKIKAGFDENESVLTISMPKLAKGIRGGIKIDEVKEEEEAARGSFKPLQIITANGFAERETLQQEEYREPERHDTTQDVIEPKEDKHGREDEEVEGKEEKKKRETLQIITANGVAERETLQQEEFREPERQDTPQDVTEPEEDKHGREDEEVEGKEENQKRENGIEEEQMNGALVKLPDEEDKAHEGEQPPGTEKEKEKSLRDQSTQASPPPDKKSKLCVPIMAGSAFLVSIVVLVIHLIRTKNPPSKKKH